MSLPKPYNFLCGQIEEAKSLVLRFHYSKRFSANVQFVGTFHKDGGLFGDQGECIAAAVFSIPPTVWSEEVLELTRLVKHPNYKFELSKLISLCVKEIKKSKKRFDLLVSYADSTQKHHGGIYQACSWFYDGKRNPAQDGILINGKFTPNRTCSSLYGTKSAKLLKDHLRTCTIQRHFDEGKFLFWKPLNRNGEKKAERLKLRKLSYYKPNNSLLTD